MDTKISIIIPVYNVEKFLSECLDSILYQTFQNFELIIVDDCSWDKNLEELDISRVNKQWYVEITYNRLCDYLGTNRGGKK